MKKWVGAAGAAFFALSGVFASREDDDPQLWGSFLGLGTLLLLVEFVLIAKEYRRLCFRSTEATIAGNERSGEARV